MARQIHFRAEHCQKYALCQKFLQVKIVKDSIWYKKVSGRVCISHPERTQGAPKIVIFEKILNCMAKYIHFWAERCQKDALCQKMPQIKVVKDSVCYKNVSRGICLSPQRGARGIKDCHL